MKATVSKHEAYDVVRIDMTDADAAAASAVGRSRQEAFAFKTAHALTGDRVQNATLWYLRGKRGVSNRGFIAAVRIDR